MAEPSLAADLAAALRGRGLRVTPQREQVLDAVHRLAHATPEQISDALPDVDLTTVYRTLELLEDIELVKHAHLGHGAPVYRPAGDEHIHVVCHSCGSVSDADPDLVQALADRLRGERGFEMDRSHFTVFGRCADCAGGTHTPGPRPHGHGAAPHLHGPGHPQHGPGAAGTNGPATAMNP
jgi:Fur family transcriptional regulator, ferric uptake regulator